MDNKKESNVQGKTHKVHRQNDDRMNSEKLVQILKDISNDSKILNLLKDNPVEIAKMYGLTGKSLEALTSADDLLLVKRPRNIKLDGEKKR
ncbi:hypothetical protein [Chengkuizengella sediminis]|uniref:hypothetical protein n=1 Tax=Chengkuizengella sediminis TaxID=1885917 RepID=UPI00138A4F29|nr:hypothetical protein [Chengkuizengella sediminis]NDI35767.1 hypothetical protein [Chengkuizengella sediminis]